MLKLYLSKIILLGFFLITNSAYLTTSYGYEKCVKVKSICESYKRFSHILSGTLTKVEENQNFLQYTFITDTTYKGNPLVKITCKSMKEELCLQGPVLKQGERYLVFVRTIGDENLLIDDMYFNTKVLSESNQELKILKENMKRPYLNSKLCKKQMPI